MNSAVAAMVIANLAATACALVLVRRGPSPRLRLLTLTVGLMSLAQTTNFLYTQGLWSASKGYMDSIHPVLVAGLSLLAVYLLGSEIYDRNLTDRRLRLAEHETLAPQAAPEKGTATRREAVVRRPADGTARPGGCEECLTIVRRIANAWAGLYEELQAQGEGDGVAAGTSKYELVASLRARLEHSTRSGHSVL